MIILKDRTSASYEDYCKIGSFDIAAVKHRVTDYTDCLRIYDDNNIKPILEQGEGLLTMLTFAKFSESS